MIKGVLFDMDGLMVDTERLSLDTWEMAAKELDFQINLDDFYKLRGRNRDECERIFNEEFNSPYDFNTITKVKSKYMDKELREKGLPMKKGLVELLKFLKEAKIKTSVASSTNTDIVVKRLELGDIYKYFDKVVGGDMVENSKPAPDIYLKAADEIGLLAKDCIGLEDSPAGIASANSAGCYVIGIPDLDPIEGETREKCAEVLEDLSQVIDSIKKINRL